MVALIGGGVSRADGVIYTLTGSTNPAFGSVPTESFQYMAPGFVTSETDLTASELDFCVACYPSGTAVQFYPNGAVPTVIPIDFIRFTDANGIIYGFFFAPDTFSEPGTYTSFDYLPYIVLNIGTLTVQTTPEPSSLLLLALALLSAGALQIKKFL
jgi:hypothetical protein